MSDFFVIVELLIANASNDILPKVIVPQAYIEEKGDKTFVKYLPPPYKAEDKEFIEGFVKEKLQPPPNFRLIECHVLNFAATYQLAKLYLQPMLNKPSTNVSLTSTSTQDLLLKVPGLGENFQGKAGNVRKETSKSNKRTFKPNIPDSAKRFKQSNESIESGLTCNSEANNDAAHIVQKENISQNAQKDSDLFLNTVDAPSTSNVGPRFASANTASSRNRAIMSPELIALEKNIKILLEKSISSKLVDLQVQIHEVKALAAERASSNPLNNNILTWSEYIKKHDNISFPIDSLQDFDRFNVLLQQNENDIFTDTIHLFKCTTYVADGLKANVYVHLKKFITNNVIKNYTCQKQSSKFPEKKIFIKEKFYESLRDGFYESFGPIKEVNLWTSISAAFNNAPDWAGGRDERRPN
ncbi:uncharacterized protein LOC111693315 [Trichogramma pretiosum]|uniref:uncharacterized protein LOC111693315 n=1 Tax=Trichogramma pretiosum TaxID=7493 RepID=UPI000C71969F|nr:uncharacterized protein LOC111693315 [Trichogramma pretiosum]